MTLFIAGTAGADMDGLADALIARGFSDPVAVVFEPMQLQAHIAKCEPTRAVAVLALDSSMPSAEEETRLLAEFTAAKIPTVLVACRVDAYPSWPKTIADSRQRLDPGKRLPVFATSVELAAVPGAASGIDELLDWCRNPDRPATDTTAAPAARASSSAVLRADRLAGLRAGIVAARSESVTSVRSAIAELAGRVPEACTSDGFVDWLPQTLTALDRRAVGSLTQRLHQVHAAATRGLGGVPPGAMAAPPAALPPAIGVPDRLRPRSEEVVMMLVGASMGFGVGRMMLAPALEWAGLGVAGIVLALLAGLALAAWLVSVRRSTANRARMQRWATELITTRRAELENRIGAQLGAAEAQFSREIWNRTG
ncbi:MAG: GTPase domain-containing protein [Gordonia sp. (in: high G+C Gram-positive bacteria)]|uniref:GTPase domain-containing protein n=1 Tax=Gordonia sp. (in: high G+C Gram-positive bacteria) TaxID=84139 RepID=UPI003C728217